MGRSTAERAVGTPRSRRPARVDSYANASGALGVASREAGIGSSVGTPILVGLSDRIEALGGTLEVASPIGRGTTLLIEIPVESHSSAAAPEP